MRRCPAALLSLLLACPGLAAAGSPATPPAPSAATPPPYVLDDTAVHVLHARRLDRDYELYVALPPSYAKKPGQRFPVVFVTDAPYAFPLTRAIEARISGHSDHLPEFILVGLGYARGDTPEYSRRRDYTPTPAGTPRAVSDMPGRAPAFGGAADYRRFVAEDVFPFIESHYRADMSRKVFAGHSYGSLFGVDVLTTEPGLFQAYVLGSPSLWYDHHLMLARGRAWAAGPDPKVPLDIYLGVGGDERPRHGGSADEDMVGDLRAFSAILSGASRTRPRMRLRTDVVAGEDHLSVAPILITHGLQWVLGPH